MTVGSRQYPVDCDRCGGVIDWGDAGPDEDGSVGTTCACECLCESRGVQRLAGPVTELLLDEECPFHGADADPETWVAWRAQFEVGE